MNIIRKQISVDRGISHTPGLIPYYPYNDINANITFVTGADVDGNYNEYVCDFGKVNSCMCAVTETVSYYKEEVCTSGVSETDNSIEARFRYCDAIHHYLKISEALRTGVFGKVVKHVETTVEKVDCSNSDHDCNEEPLEVTNSEEFYDIVTNFHEMPSKYEFKPLDGALFSQIDNNIYRLTYPDIDPNSQPTTDEPYQIDQNMIEKRQDAVNSLVEGRFLVLISNYDEVIGYEKEWKEWWEKWFGTGWETIAYGETYEAPTSHTFFNFCKNFEKYLLGKIYVPNEFSDSAITGVYVPEYIYYADLYNYISWFEERDIERDKKLQEEWDKHGGDVFFEYLKTLSTHWISGNTEHDFLIEGEQSRFKFLAPYASVPIVLTQNNEVTWNYESYIDSSSEFEPEGVFSGYSVFSGTHFVELSDSGYVESKLSFVANENATVVDGIFGVWDEMHTGSTSSQILEATYHTGNSATIGVSVFKKIYHSGGTVDVIQQYGQTVLEEAPTVQQSTSMVLLTEKFLDVSDADNTQTVTQITSGPEITGDIVLIEEITATTKYKYGWWEFKDTNTDVTCGDGEIIHSNVAKYQTIQTISNVKNMVKSPNNGDLYYFYTQYNNGVVCTDGPVKVDENNITNNFRLPYQSDTYFDMEYITTDDTGDLYVGNYIPPSGVTIESGVCTINYVVGGRAYYDTQTSAYTPVYDSGIHYIESYPYVTGYKLITLDGHKDLDFYYETLKYDANLETAVYEEYNKTRQVRRAHIVGMEVGTTWTSGNSIVAPIFTDEFTSLQQYDSKTIMDISIDRGIAAAFETNYKLGECNTIEDLENYSNNFFKI